jgi:hypothetical protein
MRFPVTDGTFESLPEEVCEASRPLSSSPSAADALGPSIWDRDRGDTVPPSEDKDTNVGIKSKTEPRKEPQESSEKDYWADRPSVLLRARKVLRRDRDLFNPAMCPDPMPVPAERIDAPRTTVTNPDTADEKFMSDVWDCTVATSRSLSDLRVGATRCFKLWKAPLGYDVVDGRLTRRQKTPRPPDIWP